jgi:hypothetical protein
VYLSCVDLVFINRAREAAKKSLTTKATSKATTARATDRRTDGRTDRPKEKYQCPQQHKTRAASTTTSSHYPNNTNSRLPILFGTRALNKP